MNNVKTTGFASFYQGFMDSPTMKALRSSRFYQIASKQLGEIYAQTPIEQILQKLRFREFQTNPQWAQQNFCSLHEKVQNAHTEIPKLFNDSAFHCLSQEEKLAFFQNAAITPIAEQCIFQGVIQDLLLTRLPNFTQPLFMRGRRDGTITRWVRAMITAGAYTGYQSLGAGCSGKEYSREKLIVTFAEGLLYSLLKESKYGMVGSTVAQIGIRLFAHYPTTDICISS